MKRLAKAKFVGSLAIQSRHAIVNTSVLSIMTTIVCTAPASEMGSPPCTVNARHLVIYIISVSMGIGGVHGVAISNRLTASMLSLINGGMITKTESGVLDEVDVNGRDCGQE